MEQRKSHRGLGFAALAAALVVAFVAGRALRQTAREPVEREGPRQVHEAPALAKPAELAPAEVVASLPADERLELAEVAPVAGESSTSRDDLAEIRGRFVFEDGSAAAGVALSILGWGANTERKEKYGLPEDWIDPTGESEPDGRFALRFAPPRAYQFALTARTPGHAEANWRWGEILPGKVVDVGEVTLLRGGAIEGELVDADGNPVSGSGWNVRADCGEPGMNGRDAGRGFGEANPDTGAFRLVDLPPGRAVLSAYHELAGWVDGPVVQVVAGETVHANIAYVGSTFENRIVVSTSTRPFHPRSRPPETSIRLVGGASGPVSAQRVEGSSQSYAFDGVAPGTYTIEIDDPDYEFWSQDGVVPGARIRAQLQGSAALRLEVVDAEENPVELYSLRVRFRDVHFLPNEFTVLDGSEPLPGGLLAGMFPGDYELTASSWAGSAVVQVDGLEPAETRDVVVRLGSSTLVAGRVTRGGQPVANVDVQLIRPAEVDDSQESWVLPRNSSVGSGAERFRFEIDSTATDEAGRFQFDLGEAGEFLLLAKEGGGVQAWSERFDVEAGQDRRIDLQLPGTGMLRGRLLVPAGASPAGLRVWARPAGMDMRSMGSAFLKEAVTLGAEGTFELGPLVAGEATVFLFLPARFQKGFSTSGTTPTGASELGVVTIPDSGVVEKEFQVLDFPGQVRVSVTSDGAPLAGVQVRLVAENGDSAQVLTGVDGTTAAVPVFPAPWSVYVVDEKQGWALRHPEFVYVVAGGEQSVDVEARLIEGSVTLVDAQTREPLAGRQIAMWPHFEPQVRGLSLFNTYVTTDDEGRLNLHLPAGRVRLHLGELDPGNEEGAREVFLEWTDQGPTRAEVDL